MADGRERERERERERRETERFARGGFRACFLMRNAPSGLLV
jgi:hypothetical protein